ncbi:hypothetical protein [Massilia sp. TWR1-2-2]|uniref:hypothetical protein n=1 Tax=Massilia sp. TWR1-2-2 TaxID=2804584 RepID=UPI003CF18D97
MILVQQLSNSNRFIAVRTQSEILSHPTLGYQRSLPGLTQKVVVNPLEESTIKRLQSQLGWVALALFGADPY